MQALLKEQTHTEPGLSAMESMEGGEKLPVLVSPAAER
jgi:hypothetical protein